MDRLLYKISNVNRMDPFLMTITSGEDHWMYLSSTGCLTAGRRKAEQALFPYVTDDLLHHNAHFTGPVTVIRIKEDNKNLAWRPFSHYEEPYETEQNLHKNSLGNIVIFEEINHSLGLTFIYEWQSSAKYGFIKKSRLVNHHSNVLNVELVDGLRNIMPASVELRTQQEMSNLANAYKVSEYLPDSDCALYFMNALLMDRPEPGESLYSNLVWSYYNGNKIISVSEEDIDQFTDRGTLNRAHLIKGKPGCFLTKIEENLEPEDEIHWYTVADVYKSQSEITHIISDLKDTSKIELKLEESIRENHLLLECAIGSADGFQCTNKTINDMHHTANVLFNVFRGGVFSHNYDVDKIDFLTFLFKRNKWIHKTYAKEIDTLPATIGLSQLIQFGDQKSDPSLRRLCREYLPLILGRRHGDPSRPWNRFEIRTRDEHGNQLFYYEGNWRDIFQNWEALGYSYPLTWESMAAKFLNATTMDGYNPYRINSDGIEWEMSDPEDPWSYIGYWNDHQIIYLLKLLEHLHNYDPSKVETLFQVSIFSYANIPYRIRSFDDISANPKETIDFDFEQNAVIEEVVEKLGSDGKLVLNEDGTVYHVNLGEKILVLILAKICNLIPGGGIWLNTQRPEWNDANNALVGYGASMVTVYYLRRFLTFFADLLQKSDSETIMVSSEVCRWFNGVKRIASEMEINKDQSVTPVEYRMEYVSRLGKQFEEYREMVYKNGFNGTEDLSLDDICEFFSMIKENLDYTISDSKRSHGLYHAYNTIQIHAKKRSMDVKHLDLMLEGQVSALSSGALNIDDAIKLLESLFTSDLYRDDMRSFMLYPKKETTPFLHKNIIPYSNISKSKLLSKMLQSNDRTLIEKDAGGQVRFRPQFRNSFDLEAKLNKLKNETNYNGLVIREHDLVMKMFEKVFDHRNYTGRSGTMFSYEGIGSVYWHMVSKLLLAVQEIYFQAVRMKEPLEKVRKLGHLYYDIRSGLSAAKTPEEYGAFPFDPYSHTPAHSGAQQPGMTGQVKEEILTRFGELGCFEQNGKILFDTSLLRQPEFLDEPRLFLYYNFKAEKKELHIKENQLAFTYCQVPIIYTLTDKKCSIGMVIENGKSLNVEGKRIGKEMSDAVFNRTGTIRLIHFNCQKYNLILQ